MNAEIAGAEISPEEKYEIDVMEYIQTEANRLVGQEREPVEATYIALSHKIVSSLLEQEGVTKYEDGSFDISSSTTFETGEFELIPTLFQKVPEITKKVIQEATKEDEEFLFVDPENRLATTTSRLLVFAWRFENLIEEEISKETEETNG